MINKRISATIQEINFYQKEGIVKSRNYSILFVFVLFVTFLLFRPSATGQSQCRELQSEGDIKELIKLGSTVDPHDKIDKVAARIRNDFNKLCWLFEEGEDGFEKEMAEILGNKASLKTAGGEYIRGKGKIREYWREMKERYNRVEFELVWAVIVHEERRPILAKDTDNMVYENFKYHLINQRKGEIVQNQNGEGERSGMHTHGCDWIGN